MDVNIANHWGLLQPYWLLLFPLPWLWLYWHRSQSVSWPRILPVLTVRYPLLGDLPQSSVDTKSNIKNRQTDIIMSLAMSLMVFSLSQPVHYTGYFEAEKNLNPLI